MVFLEQITESSKTKERSLRINFKDNPTSLDPRRGRNMSGTSQLHAMLFEGLMRLNPDGTLICAQASSYDISPDQKTYTFHLRDVFWSDGTPVTAYDFEKTWKDILTPSFPSRDADALFCIKNAEAAKKEGISLDKVGIYAKSSKTLVVELGYPAPHFLHMTASSVLFPINQHQEKCFPNWYLEASDHFVCNGPFKLTLWKPHDQMVLEKNKYYHESNKIKLDSIYISMISHGIATLHMYASDFFDLIALPLSSLPFDLYRELTQKKLLHVVRAPGTAACMFNTKKFPFHNVNIRKAFGYTINRQFLIDNVTLLKEEPAFGIVPPMLKENGKKSFFKDNDIEQGRMYLEKGLDELKITARDLNGKITFSFWKHDHGCPILPQSLQEQWLEKLGVRVELEALDFKTLHEKGEKGLFSMGYFAFFSMYCMNSIELLDRFKYSSHARNYARWQNDDYACLLNKAAQPKSKEENFKLLEKAEKILMDEMPFAPIFHWNYAFLVQPGIKGFAVCPLGYLCLDRLSINKTRQKF